MVNLTKLLNIMAKNWTFLSIKYNFLGQFFNVNVFISEY
jgi:hypothetical protein